MTLPRGQSVDCGRGARAPPPEFAPISGDLSERQRSLLMVFSTVLSKDSVERLRDLISEPREASWPVADTRPGIRREAPDLVESGRGTRSGHQHPRDS
ncbi:hypothetical protein DFP74_3322 [Nocardiopsis sp. Huas11]|nr:hypothetical protein DFP74_3322 [Nocardiopsis sp. Huas11]